MNKTTEELAREQAAAVDLFAFIGLLQEFGAFPEMHQSSEIFLEKIQGIASQVYPLRMLKFIFNKYGVEFTPDLQAILDESETKLTALQSAISKLH